MRDGSRVVMTTDAVGGIWTYALDLARGLTARGGRVTLAVLGPPLDPVRRAQAELQGIAVVETGQPPEWLARDVAEVAAAAESVARIARETEADLVHLNHPVLAGLEKFPCPTVGVAHSCVATWWAAVRGTPLPEDFAWRTTLVAGGYRALDALIAPSRAFAEATKAIYGPAIDPIVVHNGRAGSPAPDWSRPAVPKVFAAGRLWDEGKNIAALDRAAARLGCAVEAAGPLHGPNGASIALSHVETPGSLAEDAIAARLAARPVFASPALYEPFGLAVVEAAQAGCVLVLSDIPSFRELWDGAAVFVPAQDDRALANALATLLDDPDRREALGRTAAARAFAYTLEAMLEGTVAVHRRMLEPDRRLAS